jgi:hypothetical protein
MFIFDLSKRKQTFLTTKKLRKMTQVTKTTGTHSQSKKECKFINILGESFVYSDKRGYGTWAMVPASFAKKIIENIPALHYYADRMPSENQTMKLSWSHYGDSGYELRLHSGSNHVYTSEKFQIN